MKRFIHLSILILFVGIGTLGAILAILSLWAGSSQDAINAVVLPITFIPAIAFIFWTRSTGGGALTKMQNVAAGLWIIPSSAIAAYIARFLPSEIVLAMLSSTVINVALWLVLVQITRKIYRAKRQHNYSIQSGRTFDDPDIARLANNTDLATATVVATLATINCTIVMNRLITDYLIEAAIVVMAMNIGYTLGFMWFNLCPNQSDIRELMSERNTDP